MSPLTIVYVFLQLQVQGHVSGWMVHYLVWTQEGIILPTDLPYNDVNYNSQGKSVQRLDPPARTSDILAVGGISSCCGWLIWALMECGSLRHTGNRLPWSLIIRTDSGVSLFTNANSVILHLFSLLVNAISSHKG